MIHTQGTAMPRRLRTRTMTRQIPHTIDGRTHVVTDAYDVAVPVTPVDWDRIVTGAVATAMILFVLASIAWTTASVGALLARAVPAPIGYTAASGFDLAWVICMGLEWLDRHEPDRADAARRAGTVFLVLAMASVAVHGWLAASLWVGLIGCAISAIAKRLWALTLRRFARPLDPRTQQWYAQEAGQIAAQLALAGLQRQLNRSRARIDSERLALALTDPTADAVPAVPILSGQAEDNQDSSSARVHAPDGETLTDTIRRLVRDDITEPGYVLLGVKAVHGPTVNEASVIRLLNRVISGGAA